MNRVEIEKAMAVAAEIFAMNGYSGVGMRELAKRCGVSLPTLYHYFGSKEELFHAVSRDKFQQAIDHIEAKLAGQTGVDEQIAILTRSVFELLTGDRVLFLLLRRDLVDGSILGREMRCYQQHKDTIEIIFQILLQRHPDAIARPLAFTVASLMFGYCEFICASMDAGENDKLELLEDRLNELVCATYKLIQ